QKRARRLLDRVNAATRVEDLALPPSHRLHKLKGDLAQFWSMSVNDQWRVVFKWTDAGPAEVRLMDYHWRRNNHAADKSCDRTSRRSSTGDVGRAWPLTGVFRPASSHFSSATE